MLCEKCKNKHDGSYASGRFCSSKCARSFSTSKKRLEINRKVSNKLTGRKLTEEHKKKSLNALVRSRCISLKRIKKKCLQCEKNMSLTKSQSKRKFCSASCWILHSELNKNPFSLYRERCKFNFNVYDYPDKFDLNLLEQKGWYSPSNKKNNLDGVSRDHILSIADGFKQGINPEIMSHPANCQLILHRKNQSKRNKSFITIDKLIEKIENWND